MQQGFPVWLVNLKYKDRTSIAKHLSEMNGIAVDLTHLVHQF